MITLLLFLNMPIIKATAKNGCFLDTGEYFTGGN
jgi:hypothetical protein